MELINTKKCSKCKLDKPFNEFRKCKTGRYGIMSYCLLCHDIKSQESYEDNREDRIESIRKWTENNLDKTKEYKRNWAQRDRNKEK
jgi:hypothetical protein